MDGGWTSLALICSGLIAICTGATSTRSVFAEKANAWKNFKKNNKNKQQNVLVIVG
jgi:hypothetical protein